MVSENDVYEKTPMGKDLEKFIDRLQKTNPEDKRSIDATWNLRQKFRRKWKRDPFNLIFKVFGEGVSK